jgi:hypothetical protein
MAEVPEGDVDLVAALDDAGAELTVMPEEARPAFVAAYGNDYLANMELELERRRHGRVPSAWQPPVILESASGPAETAKTLLVHDSGDVDFYNCEKTSNRAALWRACYKGHAGVLRLLAVGGCVCVCGGGVLEG